MDSVESRAITIYPDFKINEKCLTQWLKTETRHGDQVEIVQIGGLVALFLKRTNTMYLVCGEGGMKFIKNP